MGRKKEPDPKIRHVNLRLRVAEYDWLSQRAARLSQETGVKIKPTAVAHSFVARAMKEEEP